MTRLIKPTDIRLNMRSKEVNIDDISSIDIQNLMNEMCRLATDKGAVNYKKTKTSLVGLSAPQLGDLVRIILVDLDAGPNDPNYTPNMKFFINPRIIAVSKKENLWKEGCFSTSDIVGAVYRHDKVTVVAYDEKGHEFTHISTNKFQARILQHEIDHLDGIRFPSRIRSPKQLHLVTKAEKKDYKQNWATWTKLYPFEKWLSMYNGEKVEKL